MLEHAISLTSASRQPRSLMHRRSLLVGAGAAGMVLGTAMGRAYTQIAEAPDYSLRISPLRLELAPGKVIDTFAYNGTVPGPVLRLREGRQVSIDIRNDTDIDDIIHTRALRTVGGGRCDGRRVADGGTRRRAALHLHSEAYGDALVS